MAGFSMGEADMFRRAISKKDIDKLLENEKAFESHRHEVCRADEMFKQIEKEIQAFEDRVSQDLEEMTNIQKILISFV